MKHDWKESNQPTLTQMQLLFSSPLLLSLAHTSLRSPQLAPSLLARPPLILAPIAPVCDRTDCELNQIAAVFLLPPLATRHLSALCMRAVQASAKFSLLELVGSNSQLRSIEIAPITV